MLQFPSVGVQGTLRPNFAEHGPSGGERQIMTLAENGGGEERRKRALMLNILMVAYPFVLVFISRPIYCLPWGIPSTLDGSQIRGHRL